jgi:hypothetical protein
MNVEMLFARLERMLELDRLRLFEPSRILNESLQRIVFDPIFERQ